MEECIFCKIAAGKIPSEIVFQDDEVVAFRDIHPLTPVHILIIPKKHIPSVDSITEAESPLLGRMIIVANQLAKREGIFEKGYRLVINAGEYGGQLIQHLHMHLLGGRRLGGKLGN